MDPTERAALLKKIFGNLPHARVSSREARTPEESKRWESEGVIVNPPSLDFAIEEAIRRHEEAEAAKTASETPKCPEPPSV